VDDTLEGTHLSGIGCCVNICRHGAIDDILT